MGAQFHMLGNTRYYTSDKPERFMLRHAAETEIAPGLTLREWQFQTREIVNSHMGEPDKHLWEGVLDQVDTLYADSARRLLRLDRDKRLTDLPIARQQVHEMFTTYGEALRAVAMHGVPLALPDLQPEAQTEQVLARMNEAMTRLKQWNRGSGGQYPQGR